jgi:uncharacterized protein (UPF0262 family)
MAAATLSELRIDEATWSTGSSARRHEWRLAIAEVVQEGRFELSDGKAGSHRALLALAPGRASLTVHDDHGEPLGVQDLPVAALRPLMDEYMQICIEMGKLGVGANSPRLEALDIAKRLTHDEAGETVRVAMKGLRPDHGTARRLFTLLVTLYFDTTKLAAPAHPVRS